MKSRLLVPLFLLLSLALCSAATVTLAWDPNPEPDIAGYRIYWKTNMATYATNRFVAVTNGTSGSVSNLLLGGTYRFVATAYNTAGLESDYSNEVGVTLPTVPTPPQNLRTNAVILRASLLSTEHLDGLWAVVHTYEDVVFTNNLEMAFYKTQLDLDVVPTVSRAVSGMPPLPPSVR